MFRKTVLATAIVGAGLGSMSGAAFAGDAPSDSGHGHHHDHHGSWDHHKSSSCSNNAEGAIDNSGAETLVGVLDGSQGALGLNVCDILNDNSVLSGNNVALLGDAG